MTRSPTDITPGSPDVHPASYRDPAGFVFTADAIVYRQVNRCYATQYDTLMNSGLYDCLTREGLLLPHTEVPGIPVKSSDHYKTLLPHQLSRLSYPAEWCPRQLRDAALLTLRIQQHAMNHGMILKDATPFNIQFDRGKPIFIDSLSFDRYDPSMPWIAYRQFCEGFLFPLYIHRYARTGTNRLASAWPEGIPAAAASRLMPFKSRWNAGAWLHVHLQARIGSRQRANNGEAVSFSKEKLDRLIEHLTALISRILPSTQASSWSNYYDETILHQSYLKEKQQLFRQYLTPIAFSNALDLGCNDGVFSKILTETGASVIAVDADWPCIEKLYEVQNPAILPLCIDLANPTPATGFQNSERATFTERASSDLVTALALVHHLALGNNIPLDLIAAYFSRLAKRYLIIEFVPLSDEKALALISRKETAPVNYDPASFESAFNRDFKIERKDLIPGTERVLYLMSKRG